MAIVENRSTEIGDVIRIQTEVPIIGIVSLNSFVDDTVGEITGVAPGMVIPIFNAGNRQDSSLRSNGIVIGDVAYTIARNSGGSITYNGIVSINLSTQIWDTTHPDAPTNRFINFLSLGGTTLYAFGTSFNGVIFSQVTDILSYNTVTRTWTVLERNINFNLAGVVQAVHNNNVYVMRSHTFNKVGNNITTDDPFPALFRFDLSTNTYVNVSQFPLRGLGATANDIEVRIMDCVIDTTSQLIYVGYEFSNFNRNATPNFYIYNIATNIWTTTSNCPERLRVASNSMYFDAVNRLIYIKARNSEKLITYDVNTDTWNTSRTVSPEMFSFNSLVLYNNRVYVRVAQRDTVQYDPVNNTWLVSVSGNRFFRKRFRYSIDGGLTFSEFLDLNDFNIQNIEINDENIFVIDIAYERAGEQTAGELTWNNTTLLGNYVDFLTPIYDSTIFKGQFEVLDVNVLGWALNVLEKLYQRGLLADYVDRNREDKDDTDFIAYWFSVTHLFAILVYWMRLFENIPANRFFVTRFLESFDITLPFDLDLKTLGIIYTERVSEYRKRGTPQIQMPTPNVNTAINGELLRLIDWDQNDFFFFALTEASRFGWCIGLSSPTWTSTAGVTNLIMGYEFTTSVENLTNYPLVGSSNISIVQDAAISQNVMSISGYAGNPGTYGISTGTTSIDRNQIFPIDHSLDYEIAFRVKKIETDPLQLQMFAYAYDANLNLVNMIPVNGNTSNVNSFQVTPGTEFTLLQNTYYRVNLIVHGSGTSTASNLSGNINGYRGLRFPPSARYLGLAIVVDGTAARSNFYLHDIKIRVKDLPISQGLFGVKNIIAGYMTNEGELNDDDARVFIQEKLIPYNSFLIPNWLDAVTQFTIVPEFVNRVSATEINLRFTVTLGGLIADQNYTIGVRSTNRANRNLTNDFNVELSSGSTSQINTLNVTNVQGSTAYVVTFNVVSSPVGFTAVFNPATVNIPAFT